VKIMAGMECGGRRWWFGGALVGPWWSFGAEARRGLGTNVRPCTPGEGAKDHPNMGETFTSSVCLAQLRRFRRTIAQ
jgi:hypothetical protein